MRFRGTGKAGDKIELQMTPMIDVVFQLLIFFMLTFKIAVPEGDFNVNMPLVAAAPGDPEDFQHEMKVRLLADDNGLLAGIYLNDRPLLGASPEQLIASLRDDIRQVVELFGGVGDPLDQEPEVELDPDYHLKYEYTMAALSACSGRLVEVASGRYEVVKYIEKITLATPRKPGESL